MSRGFGSTLGVGVNDEITTLYANTQSSQISISAWYYKRGTGDGLGGYGTIFSQWNGSNGFILGINGLTANSMRLVQNFSGGNAAFQITDAGLGLWQHIVITYNSSSSANVPIIYLNGVSQSVSGSASGTVGAGTASCVIGNRATAPATTFPWDGRLAHVAYWNGILLNSSEALALASGVNPLLVRPDGLSLYLPLDGINNPESDFILGNSSSITGTRLSDFDPPVQPLSRIRRLFDYETDAPGGAVYAPILSRSMSGAPGGARNFVGL